MVAEAVPRTALLPKLPQRRKVFGVAETNSSLNLRAKGSQRCPTAAKAVSRIAALRSSRVTANATPSDATACSQRASN